MTKSEKNILEQVGFAYAVGGRDAMSDAGYGTTKAKFHNQRSLGGEWPYPDEFTDVSDEDVDEESLAAVGAKSPTYQPTDIGADAKVHQFYFAAGNTKLSDCVWNPGKVLAEIAAFGTSMVPFPAMYKNRDAGLGETGTAYPSVGAAGGNYQRTGTTHGWASAPDPVEDNEDNFEQNPGDGIFTLRDMARKIFTKRGEDLDVSDI